MTLIIAAPVGPFWHVATDSFSGTRNGKIVFGEKAALLREATMLLTAYGDWGTVAPPVGLRSHPVLQRQLQAERSYAERTGTVVMALRSHLAPAPAHLLLFDFDEGRQALSLIDDPHGVGAWTARAHEPTALMAGYLEPFDTDQASGIIHVDRPFTDSAAFVEWSGQQFVHANRWFDERGIESTIGGDVWRYTLQPATVQPAA